MDITEQIMSLLELRIPPVVVGLAFAVAMWTLTRYALALTVVSVAYWMALIPAVCGALFAIAGVTAFRRGRTTVNPMTPGASTAIVTNGVYRWSRNPMYVGFAMVLLGWVLYLGNLSAALLLPCYLLYMNRYQITPEERALQQKFGSEYDNYTQRVRRWL